jgi:hypothetical protein
MNWLIGLLFTLVYMFLALILAIWGGTEGPRLFPYFEFGYLMVALGVWWWLCFFLPRRKRKSPALALSLCGVGIAMLLVLASFASLDPLLRREMTQSQELADATQVFNVQDQPLLLAESAPIGVRLKYSVRFPDNNNFWQTPFLYAQNNPRHIIGWSSVGETIEPPMQTKPGSEDALLREIAHVPSATRRYVQGTVYTITMDLIPDFLVLSADRSKVCINPYATSTDTVQKLLTTDSDTTYLITVAGTNYRVPTQNRYSLKTFYDSALQAGASPCQYRDGRIAFP